jgi:hypothetical protein
MANDLHDPELVLREIAEKFVHFVHENPDVALLLYVRIGEARLELSYRGAEVADKKAISFGIRELPTARIRV